ncbi:MAG TPA: hypothetical protein VN577_18790 [Terriglobales bacterium]|nr:hypothetical protein [Terriglobales bacterium]
MFILLEIVSIVLISVAMGLALAHALEFPGKLRLDEPTYLAVQTIYYPGFTVGGVSEPLSIIAVLVLLIIGPKDCVQFWLVLTSFAGMVATQMVFWVVTQPTNRFWLKHGQLSGRGARFFGVQQTQQPSFITEKADWRELRNKWEYSHMARAVLSAIALVALVISVVV